MTSAELRTGDGCSDGYVQTVGSVAVVEIRYEQTAIHSLAHSIGDAIALIAHDDESMRRELLGVDVLAIEQGAINGEIRRQAIEQLEEISIYNVYARDAAHRGRNHLGIVSVDGIFGANDIGNAKPVGYADNGAEVAGVLDAIQEK